MLNGIGGKTIEEAQANISVAEFYDWAAYRKKRGNLNSNLRIERGFALLATLYTNVHKDPKRKKEVNFYDFLPHEDEPPITLEQAMAKWSEDDGS